MHFSIIVQCINLNLFISWLGIKLIIWHDQTNDDPGHWCISRAWSKTAVSPLLMHCRYCSPVPSHWYAWLHWEEFNHIHSRQLGIEIEIASHWQLIINLGLLCFYNLPKNLVWISTLSKFILLRLCMFSCYFITIVWSRWTKYGYIFYTAH